MAALEVLLGRVQHELATPLLTASGFARIAIGSAAGQEDVLDPLRRVAAGVDRARHVLGVVVDLVEDGELAVVDLGALVVDQEARLAAAGMELDIVAPATSEVRCHAVPDVLAEVVHGLLTAFAVDGARRVVVQGSGDVAASSLVVAFEGDGGGWSEGALAAAGHGGASVVAEDDDGVGAIVAEVARSVGSQLGRLWLDPAPDRQTATLRLLSARPPDDQLEARP